MSSNVSNMVAVQVNAKNNAGRLAPFPALTSLEMIKFCYSLHCVLFCSGFGV